jgi:hypothetical protein
MSRIRIHIKPNSRKKRKEKGRGWGRTGDHACSPVYAFDKISNFCMTELFALQKGQANIIQNK